MKLQLPSGSPIQLIPSAHARGTIRSIAFIIVLVGATTGCDVNSALEQVSEARRLSADLLVQFAKAADTSNRAVMADTDEASVAFAGEADQAKLAVQTSIDAWDRFCKA